MLASQSARFSHSDLVGMLEVLHQAANETKWATEPRIAVEMALITLCNRAAGSDVAALLERVAALEERLANQQIVPTGIGLADNRPIAAAQRPQPQAAPLPVHKQTSPVPSGQPAIAQGAAGTPQAPQPASTPVQAEPTASVVDAGNLREVWEAVLKELLTGGKRSVHACVMQGQLTALTDNQAMVRFTATFPKERTEKEDYRAIVEKTLEQVTGHQVKLSCSLGIDMPAAKPAATPPPAAPATGPGTLTEAEFNDPTLKQAQAMFGGKVIKIEE